MVVQPWRESEITLMVEQDYSNPYTNLEVWAEFVHDSGVTLRRPAFRDGGCAWKVCFASPPADGRWTWRTSSSVEDDGLAGRSSERVSQWTLNNGTFEWTLVIPPNTSAAVHLPSNEASEIMLDGQTVSGSVHELEECEYCFLVKGRT